MGKDSYSNKNNNKKRQRKNNTFHEKNNNKKKRSDNETTFVASLSHNSQYNNNNNNNTQNDPYYDDSLDNCLAELEQRADTGFSTNEEGKDNTDNSNEISNQVDPVDSPTFVVPPHGIDKIIWTNSIVTNTDSCTKLPPYIGFFDACTAKMKQERYEKIVTWNRSMKLYCNSTTSGGGKYTPGLLPSFDVEMIRHFQIESLSKYILDACPGLKMPAFERWLIDAKLEERESNDKTFIVPNYIDPVLPSCEGIAELEASGRLLQEIRDIIATSNSTMTNKQTSKILMDLCRKTRECVRKISQQYFLDHSMQQQLSSPIKRGDRIELEKKKSTTSVSTDESTINDDPTSSTFDDNDHTSFPSDHSTTTSRSEYYTLVYHRDKKWKKPFFIKMNALHYEKLKYMFLAVHNNHSNMCSKDKVQFVQPSTGVQTKALHAFHLIVMVLMLRYSALSGGQLLLDLRGGGMQGAIHGEVFHVLHEFFGSSCSSNKNKVPLIECFGSPFNAYLSTSFGSAFADDLDWHFGSFGNFLETTITEGCCEANPPFAPGIMTALANRIEFNINQANVRNKALTFVVIVPSGEESVQGHEESSTVLDSNDIESKETIVAAAAAAKRFGSIALRQMINSSHCRLHIVLHAKEHGYVEGSQHMRPTRFKESLYDTSVVILQSTKAAEQELDQHLFVPKLRSSFASRHREETDERRKQKH